jgi:hypothetical protein
MYSIHELTKKVMKCEDEYLVNYFIVLFLFIVFTLLKLFFMISIIVLKCRKRLNYEKIFTNRFSLEEILKSYYRPYLKKYFLFNFFDYFRNLFLTVYLLIPNYIASNIYYYVFSIFVLAIYIVTQPYLRGWTKYQQIFFVIIWILTKFYINITIFPVVEDYNFLHLLAFLIILNVLICVVSGLRIGVFILISYFPIRKMMKTGYINFKNLKFKKIIGEGSNGVVYKGYFMYLPVAIKKIKISNDFSKKSEEEFKITKYL